MKTCKKCGLFFCEFAQNMGKKMRIACKNYFGCDCDACTNCPCTRCKELKRKREEKIDSYFPILIRIPRLGIYKVVKKAEELPIGENFTVLQTNCPKEWI